MSREQKLALVLGFALVLVVGVLVSDHLSDAGQAQVEHVATAQPTTAPSFGRGDAVEPIAPRLLEGALAHAPDPVIEQPASEPSTLASIANGIHDVVTNQIDAIRENPPPAAFETRTESPVAGAPTITMGERPASEKTSATRSLPGRLYVIRAQDSLWAIASREYGDGQLHDEIAAFNGLSRDAELKVGATLVLPTEDVLTGRRSDAAPAPLQVVQAPAANAPQKPAAEPAVATPTRRYVVQAQDTLGEIAQRELGTVKRMSEILKLNPKLDKDRVRVGAEILLPAR